MRTRETKRSAFRLATAATLCLGLTALAAAQPRLGMPDNKEHRATPATMFGDQLVLMAVQLMSGDDAPTAEQLDAGAMLLDQAKQLMPDDAELWRMIAEVARQRDDMDGWAAAIEEYLRITPTDDAMMYELILYRVQGEQTLSGRIRTVERMLTSAPRGSMSNPLQSRLAAYLATAAREKGDRSMMLHWLKQASVLDPTNAQAAKLTYELLKEANASQSTVDLAMVRWLSAAPADAQLRLLVAQRCFETGLYRRAMQQYDMASKLSGGQLPPEAYQPWVMSLIAVGQPREALKLLYSLQRAIIEAMPRPDTVTSWPGGQEQQDAQMLDRDVKLPAPLLVLWQLVSTSDDMTDAAAHNWSRLVDADTSDADAPQLLTSHLGWFAALYAPDDQQAVSMVDKIDATTADGKLARLFLAIRMQEADGANELIRQLPADDPQVQFAASMLAGDPADRVMILQRLTREQPGTMLGVLSAMALARDNELPTPSLDGARLEDNIRGLSRRLWYTDLEQEPWLVLHVSADEARYDYLNPIVCEIRVSNNARAPLAVGKTRAIPSQGILAVSATVNGRDVGRVPPIVFSTQSQLQIGSDQSVRTSLRLDRSVLGLLLAEHPDMNFNLKITAVLDPQVLANMAIVPGPTGLARRIQSIFRIGLNATPDMLARWTRQAGDRISGVERLRALARLSQLHVTDAGDDANDGSPKNVRELFIENKDGQQVVRRRLTEEERVLHDAQMQGVNAVVGQFDQMDEKEQAWVVRFVPRPTPGETFVYQPVLDAAAKSDKPLVRMMYLIRHVDSPTDASLTQAMASDDATLAKFAALMQTILTQRRAAQQAAADAQANDNDAAAGAAQPAAGQ